MIYRVQFVDQEPRQFITVDPDSPFWRGAESPDPRDFRGAIVRLRPPAWADDALVNELRQKVATAGAVAIRVLAKQFREAVVARDDADQIADVGTHREVVEALVAASKSPHRDKLQALVQRVLAGEKL